MKKTRYPKYSRQKVELPFNNSLDFIIALKPIYMCLLQALKSHSPIATPR
ncbi:hypothetical protein Scep_018963 [Stephania cephalantha]|uniref:Uncharacterized protein n=1 Tax=Stephania cephalantha TaxID=152367 RepID=A0AAP0NMD8_9MAGN